MRRSVVLFPLFVAACAVPSASDADRSEGAITSNDAKILDFRFEGSVVAPKGTASRAAIVSQLMYVQGILTTARHGNGEIGQVTLADIVETDAGDNKKITYKAALPVAWPKGTPAPTTYALSLPGDATKFDAFNAKYDGKCGSNEYGQSDFWHDWNPKASGCKVDAEDVIASTATVAPHAKATTNKYPEYDEIWKDDRLDVVAIFGIINSDTPSDWAYSEAATFAANVKAKIGDASEKANATNSSILKDTTITGKVTVGGKERQVKVDVLVTEAPRDLGANFDPRYDELSERADLILYNGHAGLGKNVNALAKKGKVAKEKYQLVLMNGCQTFAYLETTLTDRRVQANGKDTDPFGTRYLDVMGNALPGYVNNLASMSNTLFDAAIGADRPKHYNELMSTMPTSHIVVVFGEDDNAFKPR